MNKTAYVIIIIALLIGSLTYYSSRNKSELNVPGQPVSCTMEARQCPDGSSVGRGGQQCQFAACPPVGVSLGEEFKVGNTTITPLTIVEDSRCPADVQCIWAGTFLAEVTITTEGTTENRQLSIGDQISTSHGPLVLEAVEPQAVSGQEVRPSEYRLIFTEER